MVCPSQYQKSTLMAYSSTEQATGSNIKLSNITYQSGVSINFTAGSDTIYLRAPGLYYIHLDAIMSNTTAATLSSIQMYVDGAVLSGALTEATIVAAGDSEPGSITAIVSVPPQCGCSRGKAITFTIGGTTATVTSLNAVIMKIA